MRTINIKELRKARGITQAEIAANLNIQQSTISMWETGAAKPRADTLLAIAEYLGCTVDELLKTEA